MGLNIYVNLAYLLVLKILLLEIEKNIDNYGACCSYNIQRIAYR